MDDKEKEEFYNKFLELIAEDIKQEIEREGPYWTVEKAVEGRIDMLREDIKNTITYGRQRTL